MCGRYSATFTAEELKYIFELTETPHDYAPRYNVAPTQVAPAITAQGSGQILLHMRFGIEHHGRLLLNARTETIVEKHGYTSFMGSNRCLIPADGFYEWRRAGKSKVPYRFVLPSRKPFAFAALWGEVTSGQGFFIITTAPSPDVAPIHDRMPAILTTPDEFSVWLHGNRTQAAKLLRPFSEDLEIYEVSKHVNSPLNDDPLCISPINKLW